MTSIKVWQGKPYPLGATVTSTGVNFALFSKNATGVDLCLFDHVGASTEPVRIRLTEKTNHVWHCFLPDVEAGQLYAYRVYGPYEPAQGHRFNDAKLLLDPYAKAVSGLINWGEEMFGYPQGTGEEADLTRDYRDDAWGMPKCIVVDDAFDWEGDQPLYKPMAESVIYEVHVKGFTQLHPEIPEEIRGTYEAMGHPVSIQYLKNLGITAVELLPVQHFTNDQFLADKGLRNYWGYNSLSYFAPHSAYSKASESGGNVNEFKTMVKALHKAGIEVILDVVYNHTGEGNHMGPTLSFRGIDNAVYYRLVADNARFYMDYTGTGNTLDMKHPQVLQLLMDSLRYWVQEMHVDGFRFDLASTLGREEYDFGHYSPFFAAIQQDPVLSQVKLIAEPWDVGMGGYQVGNFPAPWAEWNGKYRDCARAYWKGDNGTIGEFAYRLTGSSDLYEDDGRRPYASVNFITAHDGFTLNDSVSYNEKHNDANGENNQDGHNDNRSWNCGAEGVTDDPDINKLRRRQLRNFLGTLLLSQGVPMLLGGDEWARSQGGNNNAYCQDSEISWFHWDRQEWQKQLEEFTSKLIKLRADHPTFRRPKWFQGRRLRGAGVKKDLMWLDIDGTEMNDENWNNGFGLCLGMVLSGEGTDVRGPEGEAIRDDTFLVLFNAFHDPMPFTLAGKQDINWELIINTELESGFLDQPTTHASGDEITLIARSMAVLKLVKGSQEDASNISWKQQQKAQQKSEPTFPPMPPRPESTFRDATTKEKTATKQKAAGVPKDEGSLTAARRKLREALPETLKPLAGHEPKKEQPNTPPREEE